MRIRSAFPSLRPSERKVAGVILAHPETVVHLSVTELARQSGVSDATVVKFSQRLGYAGYQDLKINLAKDLVAPAREIYGEIEPTDDVATVKEKIFRMNRAALADTERCLDCAELERAVNAMAQARRIHFYGTGASGIVALDAEQKFLRIDLPARAFIDVHLQVAMGALLEPGDVAVGISHSGQTKDIAAALATARRAGATTICITNYLDSPVARAAAIRLYTATQESAFRSGAIASRVAQLSVVDVLFIGVAVRRYEHTLACLEKTREAVADKKF
ncbi:MAG TPA: MurR/RpiR family transcriptional regulator [Limnochordia bacterium]